MSKKRKIQIVVAVVALAAIIVLFTILSRRVSVSQIVNLVPKNPLVAALVLVAIFWAKTALQFIPVYVLYISAGVLFPNGMGIVVVLVGLVGEFSIGYLSGKKLGGQKVWNKLRSRKRLGSFTRIIDRHPKTACFITRLVPMPVPVDTVSMFFGASCTPFLPYLGYSMLGSLGLMIPYVLAGQAIKNPLSPEFLIPFCISIGFAVVFFAYEHRRAVRERNETAAVPPDDASLEQLPTASNGDPDLTPRPPHT